LKNITNEITPHLKKYHKAWQLWISFISTAAILCYNN